MGICNDAAGEVLGLTQGHGSLECDDAEFSPHQEGDALNVYESYTTTQLLTEDRLLPLNQNIVYYKRHNGITQTLLMKRREIMWHSQPHNFLSIRDLTTGLRVESLIREKEELKLFNSTLSHELMQPLHCVKLFTEKLLRLKLPQTVVKKLKIIRNSIMLVISHCQTMLDRNHNDRGQLLVTSNPFNLM